MRPDPAVKALEDEFNEALSLLADYRQDGSGPVAEPLPSLLEQCETLCRDFAQPEPVRSLHHFACTGGTLITKCVAAQPNVVMLSEIDPLSNMVPHRQALFAPTDVLKALHQSPRGVNQDIIADAFRGAVGAAAKGLARRGQRLVVRDHAHSQFCTDVDPAARPTVHEMLRDTGPVLSLVSLRHPLDSFLSLNSQNWPNRFEPFTLQEYSLRYMAFLDRHAHLPMIFYEDLVADPETEVKRICDLLQLPFHPMSLDLIGVLRLSGDSGRSSPVIGPRSRRTVPAKIEADRGSAAYVELCERLDYEP